MQIDIATENFLSLFCDTWRRESWRMYFVPSNTSLESLPAFASSLALGDEPALLAVLPTASQQYLW